MGRIYLDMTVVTLPMEASAGKAVSGIIEYSACTALIGLIPLLLDDLLVAQLRLQEGPPP